MNKIYKVIWNATLGTWVAVSELAKGKTKSSKITSIVGAATVSLMVTFSPEAIAAYTTAGGTSSTATGIAIGNTSGGTGGAGAGTTQSNAVEVIAIGPNVYGNGEQSTLIGNDIVTSASASQAVVIGSNFNANPTTTTGKGGVSIGSGLVDPNLPLPAGVTAATLPKSPMANGIGAVAIGSSGDGTANSNIFNGAVATGNHALALMAGSNANALNSIAIGVASKALANSAVAIGDGATGTGLRGVALGYAANAVGEATAVGSTAQATATQTAAFGIGANASAIQAVAIGANTKAQGVQSTAIGNDSIAQGASSVAIGGDDLDVVAGMSAAATYNTLTGDTITSGIYRSTLAGVSAVAVGVQAQASGDLSTAFGTRTTANGTASVALGVGANASQNNAVALGAGSTTATNATSVTSATVNGVTYSGFSGGSTIGAGDQVSVGKAGFERQIKNVAPGAVTSTSTDAINGSQLYSVANEVSKGLNFSVNGGTADNVKLGETVNFANGTNTTAVYDAATNTYKYNVVDAPSFAGTVTSTGLQVNGNSTVTGSSTIGTGANTTTLTSTANGLDVGGDKITNVAAGTLSSTSTDAVNGSQLNTTNTNVTNLQNQTWKLQANGDTASAVKSSDTIQFLDGSNVKVTRSGNNITIGTSATPTFTSVTVNNAPTAGTDATNKTYVDGKVQTLADSPLGFVGDSGTKATRKLGQDLNVKGGATGTLVDNNIGVVSNGTDTLTVKLAKDINLGATGSVTTGNTVINNTGITTPQAVIGTGANTTTLTSTVNGLDVGGDKITNVADGSIASGSKEAVNGGQLFTTNANVTTAQNTANTANTTANTALTTA
ncbi:ESPR-type extended signal peptide-containing protein, partial [Acinetobacter rongchengensis]